MSAVAAPELAVGGSALIADGLVDRAVIHEDPFRWVETPEVFRPDVADSLSTSFPGELEWYRTMDSSSVKQYCMQSRILVDLENLPLSSQASERRPGRAFPLGRVWSDTVQMLSGPPYRDAMSRLSGVDLSMCRLHVRVCCYGVGCWLAPHTDRPSKLATHVIYLSRVWDRAWGGALQLHGSNAVDDVVVAMTPKFNEGVLLVRSDRSWHSVEAVRPDAPNRLSLLIHFET